MSKNRRVVGAPIVMHWRGEETDASVLEKIKSMPGASIRDIAEHLKWSNGRVDGSVNRLVNQGKVRVKHYLKKGILFKSVYPSEYVPKPRNIVEIPNDMLENTWKERAFVYSLSRSTIGISPRPVDEWDKKTFLREEVSVSKNEESTVITLPDSISEFYQIENSETSLSTVGDLALLTVEPILPVALPSTHPEEYG